MLASNIRERSYNVETNTVQFTKLFIVSHEPHGEWFAFRSCPRLWRSSFFRAGSLFTKGNDCITLMTLSRRAMFRRPSAVATGPSPGGWVKLISIHGSYTSFVQDLKIQRQALQPSCTSHSSFRQIATLGFCHGMIPTWQRSRSTSVCVCSRQSQLPMPYSFSSRVQVPMPPSLRRRSIVLKIPLSRERMRVAETNKICLQIEQLRYHCESIDPLDDTCDARWMSLISDTMTHVFDSQSQRNT